MSARKSVGLPVAALIAVACLAVGGLVGVRYAHSRGPTIVPRGMLGTDEEATIAVFENARDSVVFITTLERRRDRFTLNVLDQPRGTGTGFLWDAQGHVVTNFHVVAGGNAFKVALADQQAYDAQLVGADPSKDLAVLKVDARDRRPLPIGTSGDLRVGQKVLAIGNPFGLDHSLTTGVVSATGREIKAVNGRTIHDVIQTDAAINPGNSGGPLLDSTGRLIGVNTAIYSPSGASSGIGFAVPVDTMVGVVPQLIEFGRVTRPSLGIMLVPPQTAARLDLPGPMVSSIVPGGPAQKAGIRGLGQGFLGRVDLGDIILAVDGERVKNADELLAALERHEIGEQVTLTLLRERGEIEVDVSLTAME
jgi:S1-C subfamily serine protease